MLFASAVTPVPAGKKPELTFPGLLEVHRPLHGVSKQTVPRRLLVDHPGQHGTWAHNRTRPSESQLSETSHRASTATPFVSRQDDWLFGVEKTVMKFPNYFANQLTRWSVYVRHSNQFKTFILRNTFGRRYSTLSFLYVRDQADLDSGCLV